MGEAVLNFFQNNIPAHFYAPIILSVMIYLLIYWAGSHLKKEKKLEVTYWLQGKYEETWAEQFCLLADRLFVDLIIGLLVLTLALFIKRALA